MARLAFRGLVVLAAVAGALAAPARAQTAGLPVAADDVATTTAGTAVKIDVIGNDSDPDGDPLTLVTVGTPAYGSASFTGNVVLYEPATSNPAVDYFTYGVTDGDGHTVEGLITVYVDTVPPPPPTLVVSPT